MIHRQALASQTLPNPLRDVLNQISKNGELRQEWSNDLLVFQANM